MEKQTINQKFDLVLDFLTSNGADHMLIEFIADRKVKNSKKSNVAKVDKNADLKTQILEIVNNAENPLTGAEIIAQLDEQITTQKLCANIKNISEIEKVAPTKKGEHVTYKLATV